MLVRELGQKMPQFGRSDARQTLAQRVGRASLPFGCLAQFAQVDGAEIPRNATETVHKARKFCNQLGHWKWKTQTTS